MFLLLHRNVVVCRDARISWGPGEFWSISLVISRSICGHLSQYARSSLIGMQNHLLSQIISRSSTAGFSLHLNTQFTMLHTTAHLERPTPPIKFSSSTRSRLTATLTRTDISKSQLLDQVFEFDAKPTDSDPHSILVSRRALISRVPFSEKHTTPTFATCPQRTT
jgi:hypothetical protein